MKKSLMLIVALMTMVLLVGCNNNEEVINNNNEDENVVNQGQNEIIINNDEDEIPEELASTKTLAFFQKFVSGGSYTMEMSAEYEGVKTTAINAYDGDDIYTESEYQGMKSCLLMKDGYQYVIDHEAKTCIKMQMMEATTTEIFADEEENYKVAVATGNTEYNGKNYDYEEFTVDGEKVQYLFDGDDLKVIKATALGEETTVEIVKFEKGVDKSLFEVPSGYTIMDY